MPHGSPPSVTAILLAGSRPGGDPLARSAGVVTKALVPVAGEPMINRTARALLASPLVDRLVVLAQQPRAIMDNIATNWLESDPRVVLRVSGAGISQSLIDLIDDPATRLPLLVTTADNVLLTPDMVSHFAAGARGADIAIAMVERQVLEASHPGSRRTWLKFRGGAWSGANLFWVGSHDSRGLLAFWRRVEQDRKKGRKVIGAFGPMLLIAAMLRLLTLPAALERAGRRFGCGVRLVPMPQAEACIDADKPEDIVLIEEILAAQSPPDFGQSHHLRPTSRAAG